MAVTVNCDHKNCKTINYSVFFSLEFSISYYRIIIYCGPELTLANCLINLSKRKKIIKIKDLYVYLFISKLKVSVLSMFHITTSSCFIAFIVLICCWSKFFLIGEILSV